MAEWQKNSHKDMKQRIAYKIYGKYEVDAFGNERKVSIEGIDGCLSAKVIWSAKELKAVKIIRNHLKK